MSDIVKETISYEEARLQLIEQEKDEIRNLVWRTRGEQNCDFITTEEIMDQFEGCNVKEVTSDKDVMLYDPEEEIKEAGMLEEVELDDSKVKALEEENDLLVTKLEERSDILRDKEAELEELKKYKERAERTTWTKVKEWFSKIIKG